MKCGETPTIGLRKLSIVLLLGSLMFILNGCLKGCEGGGPRPSVQYQYGSIEGYVYAPEIKKQPIKGTLVFMRVREQAPPGYMPVEGAEIYVEGTNKWAVTDKEGYFKIEEIPVGKVARLRIIPPVNLRDLYDTLYIDVPMPVEYANSTVPIGTYGAVSLPSHGATGWDVVINYVDFGNYGNLKNDPKEGDIKVGLQIIDNGNKSPVIGITKANLRLLVNDKELEIIGVSQPQGETSSPAAVCLVIDRSGSMSGNPLEDAKVAAKHFVSYITSNDMVEVISFASNVKVEQEFTNDKQALYNAIDRLVSGGATALYDAIWKGLDDTAAMPRDYRKAVIVLTDGGENASSPEHGGWGGGNRLLIAHAKELGIPVYTIGLKGYDFTREKVVGRNRVAEISPRMAEQDLQEIANQTGGEYFFSPTSEDLYDIYTKIAQRVSQQYIIQAKDTVKIFQKDIPGDEIMKKGMYGDGKFGVNILVKVNYGEKFGEGGLRSDLDIYEVYADSKIKVYGEDNEGNPIKDKIIGEKYWGSTGVLVGVKKLADGTTLFKIAWNNNEISELSKIDVGWVVAEKIVGDKRYGYVWRYDIQSHLRGLDISHWNSPSRIEWNKVYDSGRRFVMIKATEGTVIDSEALNAIPNIIKAGFYVGLYHFVNEKNLDDASTQATYFATVFNERKKALAGRCLLPVLDFEPSDTSDKTVAENYVAWINKWMEEVKKQCRLSVYPILYTNVSLLGTLTNKGGLTVNKYPLWISDINGDKYFPDYYGWNWAFRQYAGASNAQYAGRLGRIPGLPNENSGVDLDIFNGNVNDLNNFLIH
jgi:VWFA-related protein